MKISVIICTYNGNSLKVPLNSLAKQDFDQEEFEVLLIDDGSTSLKIPYNRISNFRIHRLSTNQGLSRARNLGIDNARGDIIAFTDDDCKCDENWLESIIRFFDSQPEKVVGMGGRIEPQTLSTIWEIFTQYTKNPFFNHRILHGAGTPGTYLKRFFSSKSISFKNDQLLLSAMGLNSAYRAHILKLIRPDDDLRRGVDLNLNNKIVKAGYSIKYCNEAIVYHPHRSGWKSFCTHVLSYGETTFNVIRRNKQIPMCYPLPLFLGFFLLMGGLSVLLSLSLLPFVIIGSFIIISFYYVGNFRYSVQVSRKLGKWRIIVLFPILELIRESFFDIGWLKGVLHSFKRKNQ